MRPDRVSADSSTDARNDFVPGVRRLGLSSAVFFVAKRRPAAIIKPVIPAPDVDLARAGNRQAIEDVFRQTHPGVSRLARALCGDKDLADRIVDVSFRHALAVLPRWNPHMDPDHWFAHHTLQNVRRLCQDRPDSTDDLLVTALPIEQRSPDYVAFVRGMRRLPPQQAEALILHHGERLNERLVGVSMDCSMQAAANHLRAADAAMQALVGERFEPLARKLRTAVVALAPPASETDHFVTVRVNAWAARRAAARFGRLVILVIVVIALLVAWRFRGAFVSMIGAFG